MDRKKVKEFWNDRAASGEDLVTHGDRNQVDLEIEAVMALLKEDDTLLDMGCGNGFSTVRYAEKCREVVGADYSEGMIQSACERFRTENLKFVEQDVLALTPGLGRFSVVLTTRCLINLDSWEKQTDALTRLCDCLLDNGRLILIEGSRDGRAALNELRQRAGLAPMPDVWHNLDFDEKKLQVFLRARLDKIDDIRFGLYDVLTRVQYPLGIAPEQPRYGSPFHAAAREVSRFTDNQTLAQCSREFLQVWRKRPACGQGKTSYKESRRKYDVKEQ